MAKVDYVNRLFESVWTIVFAGATSFLIGSDFGISVGIASFVVIGCVISIYYDVKAMREAGETPQ